MFVRISFAIHFFLGKYPQSLEMFEQREKREKLKLENLLKTPCKHKQQCSKAKWQIQKIKK